MSLPKYARSDCEDAKCYQLGRSTGNYHILGNRRGATHKRAALADGRSKSV